MTNAENANVLAHHGILGQKWGVRRYQNKDGSLTNVGEMRRNKYNKRADRSDAYWDRQSNKMAETRSKNRTKIENKYDKKISKIQRDIDSYDLIRNGLKDKKGRDILTKDDVSSMRKELVNMRDSLASKKKTKLDDFDAGSKYVETAFSNIKERSSKYLRLKAESESNPSIKNTAEFQEAKKAYKTGIYMSAMYNTPSRVLILNDPPKMVHRSTQAKTLHYLSKSLHLISKRNMIIYLLGYIKNIRKGKDIGKKNNQKLHGLPYERMYEMLEYKLKKAGIRFVKQEESYTSQCSPYTKTVSKEEAQKSNRKQRGLYVVKNEVLNADVVHNSFICYA